MESVHSAQSELGSKPPEMLTRLSNYFFSDPNSTASVILRVFQENFHVYRKRYAIAFIFMVITAGSTATLAWLIRDAINDIFVDQKLMMIWVFGGLVVGLSIVKGFATYAQTVMLAQIGNNVTARMQRRIFDKLLRLGVGHFANTNSSGTVVRVSNAARSAGGLMNSLVTSVGNDTLTLLALMAVMLMQSTMMTLLTLVIAPPIIIGVVRLIKKIRNLSGEEFAGMGAVVSSAQETSAGIRIIKSFTLEDSVRERAGTAIAGLEAKQNTIARLTASTSPLMESLGGVAIGLALIYAGWQTIQGGATPGEFMAFIVAFLLAYEPAKRLARLRVNIERNVVMVRMIFSLLDTPEETPDAPDAVDLGRVEGQLKLKKLTFSYRPKLPVLRGVSMRANSGEVVALVGPSGGGKTTIVNLIQRFYEPDSGEILVDGHDIRTATRASLRRNVAFVSQDPFLFDGTVRENIQCGRSDATEDEVIAAAQAAHAWDFITALPRGLDTPVGENGALLSGGQRQRVTIARAILKGAPILLLDEATSALDTSSERKVQAALDELMKGRTTIVIAHRLSTILRANRIYVLKNGKVVEEGTHKSLLAANKTYAKLYRSAEFGQAVEPVVVDAAQ